jgi:hypothetical protein
MALRLTQPLTQMSTRNTGLVKIMLTLMDYFSPADRRTPWVTGHLAHIMYVL